MESTQAACTNPFAVGAVPLRWLKNGPASADQQEPDIKSEGLSRGGTALQTDDVTAIAAEEDIPESLRPRSSESTDVTKLSKVTFYKNPITFHLVRKMPDYHIKKCFLRLCYSFLTYKKQIKIFGIRKNVMERFREC